MHCLLLHHTTIADPAAPAFFFSLSSVHSADTIYFCRIMLVPNGSVCCPASCTSWYGQPSLVLSFIVFPDCVLFFLSCPCCGAPWDMAAPCGTWPERHAEGNDGCTDPRTLSLQSAQCNLWDTHVHSCLWAHGYRLSPVLKGAPAEKQAGSVAE